MDKKSFKYLLFFLIFLVFIYFLTPLSGDDYGCFNGSDGSFLTALDTAKGMYFSWEGRFIGRILISIFVYHKFIFNIITPILICTLFVVGIKLMKEVKNKGIYFLLFIAIIFQSCNMFAQVYTWVAGTVTYLYPTVILIVYFTYIYLKKNTKFKWYDYLIFFIVNIIGTMFVENIGCSLVVGNFLLMIYFFKKDKTKFYTFLGCFITSSISLSIMLLSPGSAERSLQNLEFNNLNIFEKIYSNIPNLIRYLFTNNLLLLLLMLIVIIYVLRKKKINVLIIILFSIIPLLSIFQNLSTYTPVYIWFLEPEVLTIIDFSKPIFIWYWILYLILFIYAIYFILKKDKDRLIFIYFLIAVSLVSTLVMLILNTWGDRVTYFTVITLSITSVIVINEIIGKRFIKILTVLGCLIIIYYLFLFVLIYTVNEKRLEEIYIQSDKDIKEIKMLKNPVRYLWNNNIPGDYFKWTYRDYLGLDKDVSLEVYRITYKEYVLLLFK